MLRATERGWEPNLLPAGQAVTPLVRQWERVVRPWLDWYLWQAWKADGMLVETQ
jgi:hypothetical protein